MNFGAPFCNLIQGGLRPLHKPARPQTVSEGGIVVGMA
jgi:hypothetical protein